LCGCVGVCLEGSLFVRGLFSGSVWSGEVGSGVCVGGG